MISARGPRQQNASRLPLRSIPTGEGEISKPDFDLPDLPAYPGNLLGFKDFRVAHVEGPETPQRLYLLTTVTARHR